MNRPLSPQARASVQAFIDSGNEFGGLMQEVLDSEAWWRGAVKNSEAEASDDEGQWCVFCANSALITEDIQHQPDCPWKLAQDE